MSKLLRKSTPGRRLQEELKFSLICVCTIWYDRRKKPPHSHKFNQFADTMARSMPLSVFYQQQRNSSQHSPLLVMASLSGPQGYAQARVEADSIDGSVPATSFVRIVDNRPYFPLLKADPTNKASIIEIANAILSRSNDNAQGNCHFHGKVNVTAITGGLTNALFKVDLPNSNSVLLRIFGAEGFIDRDEETTTFSRLCHRKGTLHDQLELVGRFGNGRVETWIPNMRPSSHLYDFRKEGFALEVARQMARLHYGFDSDASALGMRIKDVPRQPKIWKVIESWIDELSENLSHEKFRNDTILIDVFYHAIMGIPDHVHGNISSNIHSVLSSLTDGLAWLKNRVETRFPDAQLAFCHNDVNAANILLDASTDENDGTARYDKQTVCIIDYEYCSTNYAMYDVANFFCEHCGGNDNGIPNYDLIPSVDRLVCFLHEYVRERDEILSKISMGGDGEATASSEVLDLVPQVELFQMASCLYWASWGILQATGEVINGTFRMENALSRLEGDMDQTSFDYLRYGKNRLARFRVERSRLVSQSSV
jgi:thiamine kinase-like enzyme